MLVCIHIRASARESYTGAPESAEISHITGPDSNAIVVRSALFRLDSDSRLTDKRTFTCFLFIPRSELRNMPKTASPSTLMSTLFNVKCTLQDDFGSFDRFYNLV